MTRIKRKSSCPTGDVLVFRVLYGKRVAAVTRKKQLSLGSDAGGDPYSENEGGAQRATAVDKTSGADFLMGRLGHTVGDTILHVMERQKRALLGGRGTLPREGGRLFRARNQGQPPMFPDENPLQEVHADPLGLVGWQAG